MQYICINRYENNINLLKEYYSMSTLEKLDKVDFADTTYLARKCPTDHQRTGCTGKPFLHSGVRTPQTIGKWRIYKKYIAVLDAEKLNQGFVVFCSVKLRRLNRDIAAEFTRIIQDIPEVTECYNISGSYDYLLKIHSPNMKYYQEFILNVLGTIDSLGSLESTFVMNEVKHEYGIHI